jgi:O-antigen/teichoic acid export membrane protein
VAVPLAVVTTFLAPAMIYILGGQEYLPYGAIALMIMVWSMPVGWINSVTNYVLIALGQQRALTRAFLIGLSFNVVANLIFIPIYGYPAAAVITVLSEIVEGIPFYITLNQTLAPIPWFRILWRPAVSGLIMLATTWLAWQLHPLVGLLAGGLVYPFLLWRLGAFDEAERKQLISTLPSRLRHRLNASPIPEPQSQPPSLP